MPIVLDFEPQLRKSYKLSRLVIQKVSRSQNSKFASLNLVS